MDNYEPVKVLGEGSFGKVYLMKHRPSRDFVCTKVIKLKNMKQKEQEACRNEVDLMKRLKHPNIVGYRDSFLYKNCLCIIMEYCDAGDLGGRVTKAAKDKLLPDGKPDPAAKEKLLPESKIWMWFTQIALGLQYMHRHHVLHRDIKTQNIFILSSGRIVLGDLGISKVMEGTMDFASTCIGTPYYMSPEIFQNSPYNHKSDVWALGCVLYELATLKHAFDGESLNSLACKIIKGKYPPPSNRYTRNMRGLIKDMLNTNPKARPDIEQVLKKPYLKQYIVDFVNDCNTEGLPGPTADESMAALMEQLEQLSIKMPTSDEMAAGGGGNSSSGNSASGHGYSSSSLTSSEASSPSAYSLSGSSGGGAAGGTATINGSSGSAHGSGTPGKQAPPSPAGKTKASAAAVVAHSADEKEGLLRQQQHRLEIEEEKREAAELGLERLRRKAEDNKKRLSFTPRKASRQIEPSDLEKAGLSGSGPEDPTPNKRERRPSLLARLAGAAGRRSSKSPDARDEDAMADAAAAAAAAAASGDGASLDGNSTAPVGRSPPAAGASVIHRRSVSAPRPASPPTPSKAPAGGGGSGGQGMPDSRPPFSPTRDSAHRRKISGAVDLPPLKIPPVVPVSVGSSGGGGAGGLRSANASPSKGRNPLASPPSQDPSPTSRTPSMSPPRSRRNSLGLGDELQKYQDYAEDHEDEEMTDRERQLKEQLEQAEARCQKLRDDLRKQALSASNGGGAAGGHRMGGSRPSEVRLDLQDSDEELGGDMNDVSFVKKLSLQDPASTDGGGDEDQERSPYASASMPPLEDSPTPSGRLVDRVNFLRDRCIQGLGEEKFNTAYKLLSAMQDEGDGWVTYEGQRYDGADDDQVQALLEKVIGANKLHYWNLMDQLIIMGA